MPIDQPHRDAPCRSAPHANAPYRIAIIGAGFSGSLLTVHLLRQLKRPTEIFLIERNGAFGRGVAYATPCPEHLLNVRVFNMSAFPDDPKHFLRWLWARDVPGRSGRPVPPSGHAFVSRGLYGSYIQETLTAAQTAAPHHVACRRISGDVVALDRPHANHDRPTSLLHFADGSVLAADATVLCIGNFPPAAPAAADPALPASGRFIGNPWDHAAIRAIPARAPVLIIGTGLTMVDVAVSLAENGHDAPVVALSRRGLLPHVHHEARAWHGTFLPDGDGPVGLAALLRAIRAEVQAAARAGFDWRAVIDAIRPHTQTLWRRLPEVEQRRFLRHLRPYWEIHRHRLAPAVAARLDALRTEGRLRVEAGRLRRLALSADPLSADPLSANPLSADPLSANSRAGGTARDAAEAIEAVIMPRRGGPEQRLRVGAVVNCAGPDCDYARIDHPLVHHLLDQGIARPDPLRLGLEITAGNTLVAADGVPAHGLFALGPVTKGRFWEITAVPELRLQCAEFARQLAAEAERADAAQEQSTRKQSTRKQSRSVMG